MMRRTLIFSLALSLFTCSWLVLSSFAQGASTEELGKAGYYANALHGRNTASGEKYNKEALTCAHKSLPFGTKVRVTRLDNNKSVIVKVNDRGPYIEGYIVDVSRRAAEELGMIRDGVVKVKIEVVEKASAAETAAKVPAAKGVSKSTEKVSRPEARSAKGTEKPELLMAYTPKTAKVAPEASTKTVATAKPKVAALKPATEKKDVKTSNLYKVDIKNPAKKGYAIQLVTLNNASNAFREVANLQEKWPGKVLVNVETAEDESVLYKILEGPFTDRKSAEKGMKDAVKKGYSKCFVVDLSEL